MAARQYPKIIFGTARFAQFENQLKFLELLDKYGVKDLDTASVYARSEETLGAVGAPKRFAIHTKAPGFRPGAMKRASLLTGAEKSFKDLGVDRVETYYLHSPDLETPLEETLEAIQQLYKAGRFKKFGISNFTPEEVTQIHTICTSNNYVLPTVYQGNYNPISRHYETTLFPLLRSLKIAFYAYSPIAGGFLVKTAAAIQSNETSRRWTADQTSGQLYRRLYEKPALLQALTSWNEIATEAGIDRGALAYRWVRYHSALDAKRGDAVIVGASTIAQLEETLGFLGDGPLPEDVVHRVEGVWEAVKHEAPTDNFHG